VTPKTFFFSITGALLLSTLSGVRAQNLLVNGSFETPASPAGSIITLPVGTTNLAGWTLSGTGGFYQVTTPMNGQFHSWYPSVEGTQFIDFNHNGALLSQSFNTVAGQSYEVCFSVGRLQSPQAMSVLAEVVSTNDILLGSLLANAPSTNGWAPPSRFLFTATSDTATLRFRGSNGTSNVELTMDAVSVKQVSFSISIEGSHVRLCWPSQTNKSYQLQYRSNLVSDSWIDLDSPIPGTGATICSEQPTTDPQRFFRVIALP